MVRSFEKWCRTLPDDMKNKMIKGKKRPSLSQINYIWITNLINKESREQNPTTTELLEWIKTGQIDALRK